MNHAAAPKTPGQIVREFMISVGYDAYAGREEEFFAHFIRDLATMHVPTLEANRNALETASEDGLTFALFEPMRTAYPSLGLWQNANGEADIVLSLPLSGLDWAGEAKITHQFSWYEKGLTKLVGKYSSGRATNGLMIAFCRTPEMYRIIGEYKASIEQSRSAWFQDWCDSAVPSIQQPSIFGSVHLAAGRRIVVTHVWINMHRETDKEVFERARVDSEKSSAESPPRKRRTRRGKT